MCGHAHGLVTRLVMHMSLHMTKSLSMSLSMAISGVVLREMRHPLVGDLGHVARVVVGVILDVLGPTVRE